MFFRVSLLFVLLQCGSPHHLPLGPEQITATYSRYISGAGGGRGVIFTFTSELADSTLKVRRVTINGKALDAQLSFSNGITKIEASKFYPSEKAAPQGQDQEVNIEEPVLFMADSYLAVLQLSLNEEEQTVTITDFKEVESKLHP